jgi:hypothetical protein
MKEKYLEYITIGVAIIVSVFSVVYFINGFMVPGLWTFGLTVILIVMLVNRSGIQEKKWLKYVIIIGIILNLFSGIAQVIRALR